MSSLTYRSSQPDRWAMPRPHRDPSLRRMTHGPIRPIAGHGRDLVVVIAVPRAAVVRDDGFHPDAMAGVRVERDLVRSLEARQGCPHVEAGHALVRGHHEQRRLPVHEVPHGRAVRIRYPGKNEARRRRQRRLRG